MLLLIQLTFGLLDLTYFPVVSWNLYSAKLDPSTIHAFRIEAKTENGDFQPIPARLRLFNDTVFNHRLRIFYLSGEIGSIKRSLDSLLEYSEREGLGYTALRYRRFQLMPGSEGMSEVESAVITEVSR